MVRVLGWDMKVLGSIPADVNYTGYASDTWKSLGECLRLRSNHNFYLNGRLAESNKISKISNIYIYISIHIYIYIYIYTYTYYNTHIPQAACVGLAMLALFIGGEAAREAPDPLQCIILCYVMLSYIMYTILYYIVLHYSILYYIILHSILSYYVLSYHAIKLIWGYISLSISITID